MKLLNQLGDGFAALRLRDRVIAIAAVAVCLGLGGNLLLIKPQQLQIQSLRDKESTHLKEMASLKLALDQIELEAKRGIDPLAADKARLAEMQQKVIETEAFLSGDDSTASQVGILVRSLIKANPDLTLASLKTRPGAVFYSPPPPPQAKAKNDGLNQVSSLVNKLKSGEKEEKPESVVLVNKTIYKHGVDVKVKGAYPALLSYIEEMQKFPKRIFWADTKLDVNASNHRDATLTLQIYTLSDQANPPLN